MTEKLELPNKVIKADWKDDVDLDFEAFDKEAEYIAPDSVPDESINKIKSVDLKQLYRQRGQRIGKLFSLESL